MILIKMMRMIMMLWMSNPPWVSWDNNRLTLGTIILSWVPLTHPLQLWHHLNRETGHSNVLPPTPISKFPHLTEKSISTELLVLEMWALDVVCCPKTDSMHGCHHCFVCYVRIKAGGCNFVFVFVNWLNWLLAGPILCCHAPSEGCVRGRNCEAGSYSVEHFQKWNFTVF